MVARSSESANIGYASFGVSNVLWHYFPKAVQRECDAALKKTGAMAATSKTLAHLSTEADRKTPGVAMRLRLWPAKLVVDIVRVDFHSR